VRVGVPPHCARLLTRDGDTVSHSPAARRWRGVRLGQVQHVSHARSVELLSTAPHPHAAATHTTPRGARTWRAACLCWPQRRCIAASGARASQRATPWPASAAAWRAWRDAQREGARVSTKRVFESNRQPTYNDELLQQQRIP